MLACTAYSTALYGLAALQSCDSQRLLRRALCKVVFARRRANLGEELNVGLGARGVTGTPPSPRPMRPFILGDERTVADRGRGRDGGAGPRPIERPAGS